MASPPFPSAAERHEFSRRPYLARDLDGYMDLFSPTLVYRQANGQAIERAQLARHVAEPPMEALPAGAIHVDGS